MWQRDRPVNRRFQQKEEQTALERSPGRGEYQGSGRRNRHSKNEKIIGMSIICSDNDTVMTEPGIHLLLGDDSDI
jgi:hypothetical protein